MPAWSAINVEPEENVTEEIDNTKELQVDEALKLFTSALKLHAQGPKFFDEAADAYNALFESEIFQYPEAKTEYERNERRPDGSLSIEPSFTPGLEVPGVDADGIGSTFPQAIYLAHKNRGRFVVDGIKQRARISEVLDGSVFRHEEVVRAARNALDDFDAALDRDPSDADLWRETARVAAFLKSARISRFSLEAAIELDDDPAVVEVEPPSLAEGFAGEQLKEQLQVLGDHMALTHPIMKPYRDRELVADLKQSVDPLPFLPNPIMNLAVHSGLENRKIIPLQIHLAAHSWTELAMALVHFLAEEGATGRGILIRIPALAVKDSILSDVGANAQESDLSSPAYKPSGSVPADEAGSQMAKEDVEFVEARPAGTEDWPSTPTDGPFKDATMYLPSRKRSQSVAGLGELAEDETGDSKRSKRTRRRDVPGGDVMDSTTILTTQLLPYQAADKTLFQTIKNILQKLGVTDQVTLARLDEILDTCASDDRTSKIRNTASMDLHENIVKFDQEVADVLLSEKTSSQLSLSAFLEHTKSGSQRTTDLPPAFDQVRGLQDFVDAINGGWYSIDDIAFELVKTLTASYMDTRWPDLLKTALVQVISRFDEGIYERVRHELDLKRVHGHGREAGREAGRDMVHLVQMLLELHLDVCERITNPNSAVEQTIRMEAKGRLARWLHVAVEVGRSRTEVAGESESKLPVDQLTSRLLWAAVVSTSLSKDVARDHMLACWHSLYKYLVESGTVGISFPNNAVMPELSAGAAEREISKLTTMDFFIGLFQEEAADPLSVVDTLEPVLNPGKVTVHVKERVAKGEDDGDDQASDRDLTVRDWSVRECASQGLRDLWKFIDNGNTDLRLLLWARLGEAYERIGYPTKLFSCLLKSIETIMADLERADYVSKPPKARRALLMKLLQTLDGMVTQALQLAINDSTVFDIMDEEHIRTSSSALAKVTCLLHMASMVEDEMRIGRCKGPASATASAPASAPASATAGAPANAPASAPASAPACAPAHASFLNRLADIQARTWCLQYTLLKAGIYQHVPSLKQPEHEPADLLAAIHQALGLRKCCKASNKILPNLMRLELLKQDNVGNWEDHLGQVLFDLYALKLGVGIGQLQDHGCPAEKLDKKQAMPLVDKITLLANRMSMRDLLKSDLRAAIDDIQRAIGSPKSTPQMLYNLKNFTEYLKKPIHPLHLYQALKGQVDLDTVAIHTPESAIAMYGWFFLLGMMALTRFKGVDLNRRQTPGATDDLRIGAAFLRLQVQYTPDRWDAFFRLAECFDYELDEAVLWTADKMNKDRVELVKLQRNAIHCYTLALSYSYAFASDPAALAPSEEEAEALCELYRQFGMRLYASSREPFAMEPFQHADQARFFIHPDGAGAYKKELHKQLTEYKAWKFAAKLFRMAMTGKPKDWKIAYMYSKCVWKMWRKAETCPAALDESDRRARVSIRHVIRALEKTIEVVRTLPKPRHGQDPILEPHYKILVVVHKLVMAGSLSAVEGERILARQPYGTCAADKMVSSEAWRAYVIQSLRRLRDKDKSNWQHRIIMRNARLISGTDFLPQNEDERMEALKQAVNVLKEGMFTKSMMMNVWKCEAERPGRHYVYTERYIRYMVHLLVQVEDRESIEAILRRIRKKAAEFYHFNELWQSCVLQYVGLLRHVFVVTSMEEDPLKSMTSEEFDAVGERISDWAAATAVRAEEQEGDSTADVAAKALRAMREAVEIKKLNSTQMKAGPIDDLINDCYLHIYLATRPPPLEPNPFTPQDNDGPSNGPDPRPRAPKGHVYAEPIQLLDGRASSEQAERCVSHANAAPRTRRTVRRPDVLRKAEQAVVRAAEALRLRSAGTTKIRLGSLSNGGKAGTTPHADAEEDINISDAGSPAEDAEDAEDADMKDASSPPGSMHDSADDESDLSDAPPEYEDDILPSLMFPNLRSFVDAGNGLGLGHVVEGEEDTEDEDDVDGDGQEHEHGYEHELGGKGEDGDEDEGGRDLHESNMEVGQNGRHDGKGSGMGDGMMMCD